MTRFIELRNRAGARVEYAVVDEADYEHLSQYNWHLNGAGYAARHERHMGSVLMHREVMERVPGDGTLVDHINRDKLDNRRGNLRLATKFENAQNRVRGPKRRTTADGKTLVTFRIDEAEYEALRDFAAANHRSIGDQVRYWLARDTQAVAA